MIRDRKLLVSECVYGNSCFEDILLKHHGEILEKPIREEYEPEQQYLQWHEKEVFRGPVRLI